MNRKKTVRKTAGMKIDGFLAESEIKAGTIPKKLLQAQTMKYASFGFDARRAANEAPPKVPAAPANSVTRPSVIPAPWTVIPFSRTSNSVAHVANAPKTKVKAV